MSFWNKPDFEPLRQNRWFLTIDGMKMENYRFLLKECQKPSYEISFTEHKLLTQYLKYPGLLKWNPIDVKFVSTGQLNSFLKTTAVAYRTPDIGHQQISKFGTNDKINKINVLQVNPAGESEEKWSLYNCFFSKVNYGNLSYESDQFTETTITIQYDYAKIE